MISASYRNFNSYSNRNSPSNRQSRHHSQRGTTSSTNSNSASSNADFIYKGANKHHWAKLQSKIKQKLMHENISYIEDEAEVARLSHLLQYSLHHQHSWRLPRTEKRD